MPSPPECQQPQPSEAGTANPNQAADTNPLQPPGRATPRCQSVLSLSEIDSDSDMGFEVVAPRTMQKPAANLRLPPQGKITNLIVGDSNLRQLNRRRIDPSGATHIRTLSGAKVGDLTRSLALCEARPDVQRVLMHVGTNDCGSRRPLDNILKDYDALLTEVPRVFPAASVAVTAVVPQTGCSASLLTAVNRGLRDLCRKHGAQLLTDKAFNTTTTAFPTELFQKDHYHLHSGTASKDIHVPAHQVRRAPCPLRAQQPI